MKQLSDDEIFAIGIKLEIPEFTTILFRLGRDDECTAQEKADADLIFKFSRAIESAVIAALPVQTSSEVWMVSNKTFSCLFATEELAKNFAYTGVSLSTAGGMSVTHCDVFGSPPQPNQQEPTADGEGVPVWVKSDSQKLIDAGFKKREVKPREDE